MTTIMVRDYGGNSDGSEEDDFEGSGDPILHGTYGKKELIMIVMLMMKTFQVIIEILSGKIYF